LTQFRSVIDSVTKFALKYPFSFLTLIQSYMGVCHSLIARRVLSAGQHSHTLVSGVGNNRVIYVDLYSASTPYDRTVQQGAVYKEFNNIVKITVITRL